MKPDDIRPMSLEDVQELFLNRLIDNVEHDLDISDKGSSSRQRHEYDSNEIQTFAVMAIASHLDSIDTRLMKIVNCLETWL